MENVVYVIPNLEYHKGFLKSTLVNLVITDQRIIVAHVKKEMIQKAREEAKTRGESFFKRISSGWTMHERYYEMSPEDIVSEASENFSIPLNGIKEVKLKGGNIDEGKKDEMEIKWKEKSKFSGNMNQREIKKKLSDLGVKVKGGGFFGF
jgi:restriction endonuclease S subunit